MSRQPPPFAPSEATQRGYPAALRQWYFSGAPAAAGIRGAPLMSRGGAPLRWGPCRIRCLEAGDEAAARHHLVRREADKAALAQAVIEELKAGDR